MSRYKGVCIIEKLRRKETSVTTSTLNRKKEKAFLVFLRESEIVCDPGSKQDRDPMKASHCRQLQRTNKCLHIADEHMNHLNISLCDLSDFSSSFTLS